MKRILLLAFIFFAFSEVSYTQNWQWQNPLPQGNTLRDVFFTDNQNGWAVGVVGTILHTSDGGQNWIAQSSGTTFHLQNVHFADSQTGWAVGYDSFDGTILHTSDGGQNWVAQFSETSSLLLGVHFINSQTGWAVGSGGKILHTSDGGQNWTAQSSGISSRLFGVHFINSQTGWSVGLDGKILHTADGGQNWIAQSSGTTSHLHNVHFADSQNGWAVGVVGTILHTSDGGQNWIAQSSGTTFHLQNVHFADSQTGWAVGYDSFDGTILHTSDGGQNWVAQFSETSSLLLGVHFINSQTGWAVGSGGKILHTADGGQNWMAQSSEITSHHLFSVHFADSQTGWALGYDHLVGDVILHTANGGQNWVVQSSGTTPQLYSVRFTDNQNGWAVGNVGTIIHTTNSGQNWITQPSGTTFQLFSVYFTDNQNGWAVGDAGTILHTTNGGQNWAVQSSGITSSLNSVHFTGTQTGWAVGSGGKILYTSDGGQNWAAQSSGTSSGLFGVYFANSQNGWAVGDAGTILHTTNGGQNWVAQFSGLASYLYLSSVHFTDSQTGWAVGVTDGVILHTTNGGQNWIPHPFSGASTLNSVYFADNQTGWAVGNDGTILKYSGSSVFTVTSPQLTLSTAQLNPGQILTFTGTDFTPNNTATISISKPDGTEQEIDVPTNASGAFSYNYAVPSVAGGYSVRAEDATSGKFTVSKVFQVTGTPPPVDYLQITEPAAGDVVFTNVLGGSYIPVVYSDKMFLFGSTYPIQGAYRLFKYKIEYSLDNGINWQGGVEYSEKRMVNSYPTFCYQLPAPTVGGMCKVRVTDMYNPARQKISPSFTLQPQNATALQADFSWDYSYPPPVTPPLLPQPPKGVAADGVGRFYIKVRKPNATAQIQNVTVTLNDASGSNGLPEKLGRVMKATVTNTYTSEANNATATTADNSMPDNGYFWFWYVAPTDFVSQPSDESKKVRQVTAQITATFVGGGTETITRGIKIIRPPVMLAHGLGGDISTWDNFRFSNDNLLINDNTRYMVLPKAVKLWPTASFFHNALRLTNIGIGNEHSFPAIISAVREVGYACNQVDYVCHSMGGSVMRYCLSETTPPGLNIAFNSFFGTRSYGKGYAHKIITIATPHNGSPIADLLNKYRLDPMVNFVASAPPLGFIDFYNQIVPAIRDLQIDPNNNEGGINFPSTPQGTHTHRIASKIDCDEFSKFVNGTLWFVLYNAYKLNSSPFFQLTPNCDDRKAMFVELGLDPSFFDASDFVVGTTSQLAGDDQFFTQGSKTVFNNNLAHSSHFGNAIYRSSDVADRTLLLLNKDINTSSFSTLPATPNFSSNSDSDVNRPGKPLHFICSKGQKSNGKIEITSPSPGDTLTMDEALQLSIAVLDTTGFRKVNVLFQDELYSSVTAASLLNFNVQVNGNLIEKQKILAVGYYYTPDSGAVQYVDEIEVYITTNEPIASFEASPQVNLLEKGENFRPTYTAMFSTNIGELGSSPALTATIENPAVLAYLPDDNSFTALDTGSTYAVVTYKGLSDTLFFLIVSPPDSIVIAPPSSVSAAFTYQVIPCANAQATFTNTSGGATSYLWEFGDGSFSTLPNPTHQYAEPGAYNVILSATNSTTGETDLIVHTVNVANTSAVQAAISPTGTIVLCDGDTVTLSANAGTGYTYQWLRNGSPVVNGTNQQYVAFQWGYFTVRVTDATGCSTVSAPTIITVTPSPTVSATLQGPAAICLGDSTLLKATSTGGISYQWLLNGVELQGATNAALVATTAGNYAVIATNSFGCTRASFPVLVTHLPVPVITASADDDEICTGDAAVLSSSGGLSYLWNPGNLSGDIINVLPTTSTTYTVTGTDSNGCTASKDVSITVFPEPIVEIGNDTAISLNQVLHLDAGAGFSNYYWSTGATTQTIEVVVTQSNIISIQVVDTNGCVGYDNIFVDLITGTNSIHNDSAFALTVYPNPALDVLNVAISKPTNSVEEVSLILRNMLGQLLSDRKGIMSGKEGIFKMDMGALPTGNYALQVKLGGRVIWTLVNKI